MALDLTRDVAIRWDSPEPAHVVLLKKAAVSAVISPSADAAFSEACQTAGIQIIPPSMIRSVKWNELAEQPAGTTVALSEGLWPGISREPAVAGRGDETASASREPWVDANGYQIGYLRALFPQRAPVLGYLPDKLGDRGVPYDSLELALIEAWVAGGNYLLAVEPHYRAALLREDPKALASWQQLGRTVLWLREQIALFRQPTVPIATALVEPGAPTAEISNLLYRRNVSPALVPVASPPPPDPQSRLALVAANLRPPSPDSVKRILSHAESGASVVTAGPSAQQWWKVPAAKLLRSEPDREFYSLGKGQVIAYRRPIVDPSEFALDVIDVITHKGRAVRLWNAPSVIALATTAPPPASRLLHLINYGSPIDADVQARLQGHFAKATLCGPMGRQSLFSQPGAEL